MPLRQCLHPEACAKDIELPNYFCKFSDLRKEFVRFKSMDASRAIIPLKDAPNMPLQTQPMSIADMITGKPHNNSNWHKVTDSVFELNSYTCAIRLFWSLHITTDQLLLYPNFDTSIGWSKSEWIYIGSENDINKHFVTTNMWHIVTSWTE